MVQARQRPDSPDGLIDYFLETEAEEMQFETARCAPDLTPAFFDHLAAKISEPHPEPLLRRHNISDSSLHGMEDDRQGQPGPAHCLRT